MGARVDFRLPYDLLPFMRICVYCVCLVPCAVHASFSFACQTQLQQQEEKEQEEQQLRAPKSGRMQAEPQ